MKVLSYLELRVWQQNLQNQQEQFEYDNITDCQRAGIGLIWRVKK